MYGYVLGFSKVTMNEVIGGAQEKLALQAVFNQK
jgi:hypothetical protein